jgi:hypothetical protein
MAVRPLSFISISTRPRLFSTLLVRSFSSRSSKYFQSRAFLRMGTTLLITASGALSWEGLVDGKGVPAKTDHPPKITVVRECLAVRGIEAVQHLTNHLHPC